jgi:hypothetical protein
MVLKFKNSNTRYVIVEVYLVSCQKNYNKFEFKILYIDGVD